MRGSRTTGCGVWPRTRPRQQRRLSRKPTPPGSFAPIRSRRALRSRLRGSFARFGVVACRPRVASPAGQRRTPSRHVKNQVEHHYRTGQRINGTQRRRRPIPDHARRQRVGVPRNRPTSGGFATGAGPSPRRPDAVHQGGRGLQRQATRGQGSSPRSSRRLPYYPIGRSRLGRRARAPSTAGRAPGGSRFSIDGPKTCRQPSVARKSGQDVVVHESNGHASAQERSAIDAHDRRARGAAPARLPEAAD